MAMGDDTLARARRVVEGLRAAMARDDDPFWTDAGGCSLCGAWMGGPPHHDDCPTHAVSALLRLAEAVGRLADERRKRGSDPWYLQFGWNDDAYMPCIGCELMNLDAQTGDHAPDCPALALDAAFAQLAVLADDDGR